MVFPPNSPVFDWVSGLFKKNEKPSTTTTGQNTQTDKAANSGGFTNTPTGAIGNALLNGVRNNSTGNATSTSNNSGTKKVTQSYTVNAGTQPYIDQLNTLFDQIMNRGPFKYDLNGDLLYRQMADQYTQLGKQANRDATGTAAALTGGYGNSYANQVGNQAYQQQLTALNNQIPSLYDRALKTWLAQGDDLMDKYKLAAQHPGTIEALKPRTYSTTVEVPDAAQGAEKGIVGSVVMPKATTTYQKKPLYSYEDMLKYHKLLEK